jgi:hypothetical protein
MTAFTYTWLCLPHTAVHSHGLPYIGDRLCILGTYSVLYIKPDSKKKKDSLGARLGTERITRVGAPTSRAIFSSFPFCLASTTLCPSVLQSDLSLI